LEKSITSVVAIGCEHLEHCVCMALTSRSENNRDFLALSRQT